MIPYTAHSISPEDEEAVLEVLRSKRLTQGPQLEALEDALADKVGAKYCVAVSSGTAALHCAYLAVGIGPGMTVMVPPVSFVATANAALFIGAKLSFRDVNRETGMWDTVAPWEIANLQVPVSLGGNPPTWFSTDPAKVPFPAAVTVTVLDLSHGPYELMGDADAATFSLHAAKHCAAGEGGAIVTNDPAISSACRSLRDHGRMFNPETETREMVRLGFNYRLDEMSAALALSQLKRLDWSVRMRREVAARYDGSFSSHPQIRPVPHSPNSARHLYQVLVDRRDQVRYALKAHGIESAVHYPVIPLQPYYKERFGYKEGDFPSAEWFSSRVLSLPLYPTLTEQEQGTVIDAVLEVVQ